MSPLPSVVFTVAAVPFGIELTDQFLLGLGSGQERVGDARVAAFQFFAIQAERPSGKPSILRSFNKADADRAIITDGIVEIAVGRLVTCQTTICSPSVSVRS